MWKSVTPKITNVGYWWKSKGTNFCKYYAFFSSKSSYVQLVYHILTLAKESHIQEIICSVCITRIKIQGKQ